MGTLSYTHTLTAGTPENVNHLNQNLTDIQTVINGGIDATNITDGSVATAELASSAVTNDKLDPTTVAVMAGVSQTGSVRRGKTIIATEESRTNTAFGTLTTPDQVSNVVLPTDGLIYIVYQAVWKQSASAAAQAAIFIGSNQLKVTSTGATSPQVQFTLVTPNETNSYKPVFSFPQGLYSEGPTGAEYSGDVTTGQAVGQDDLTTATGKRGGICTVFAAAGTYTVSVQFKASSGSVTAKNRKLWVWTQGF